MMKNNGHAEASRREAPPGGHGEDPGEDQGNGLVKRDRLEAALREVGDSYEAMARWLHEHQVPVSGAYLSMLVSGKRDPSVKTAKKLAMALGIDLSDIVGL